MPLADSNVWLALALSKHEFHLAARNWLAECRPSEALFCRATQQSLLRLLTTAAVMIPYHISPLSNNKAWSFYERLRANKRISWADEPDGLEPHWRKLAANAKPSPKLWMDSYLAAFALAGGHRLVTSDKAFKQFNGLDLQLLSSKR
jgi:toxin-antitoxin system PIN domain toxin